MATNQSIYNAFERMWENTQTELDKKANVSHGTHVTYGTSATSLASTASAGSASTVSRSDHAHPFPALTSCTGTLTVAKGGTGKTTAKDAANDFLNALETGSSNPQDADYYISQYVGGGTTTTTYHRRPMSALWNYIAGKGDSRYLKLTGGTVTGEITSTNPDGFRITYGGYGTFLRNDGDSFYLLFTNKDAATGTWNNLRPFAVKLSTGHVNIGNGMTVTGGLGVNTSLLSIANNGNTVTIGSANATWCHFQNSADIPFYFNKGIHSVGGFTVYNTGTSLTNNNLTFAHGGGWHMTETYWIRATGGKSVYTPGNFQADGAFQGAGRSSSWYNGRDNAKFKVTSQPGYAPALSIKTTTGSWDIGTYGNYNLSSSVGDSVNGTKNWLLFNFVPDNNYTNSTNTVGSRIAFTDYGDLYIQWLNIGNSTATGDLAQITEDAIYTQQDTYEIIPPAENAGVIVGKTIFGPCITKNYNLGNSNYRWKQLYATTTTINTSDRNLKKDFKTFDSDDRYTQFFMDLKPMIFKMKDGESGRDHFGFIAQDVEDSLLSLGYTSLDFAGLCKDAKCIEQKKLTKEERRNKKFKFQEEPPLDLDENGNIQYEYSLRYQEFISLNTYMIQKLYKKIDLLEQEIEILKKGNN